MLKELDDRRDLLLAELEREEEADLRAVLSEAGALSAEALDHLDNLDMLVPFYLRREGGESGLILNMDTAVTTVVERTAVLRDVCMHPRFPQLFRRLLEHSAPAEVLEVLERLLPHADRPEFQEALESLARDPAVGGRARELRRSSRFVPVEERNLNRGGSLRGLVWSESVFSLFISDYPGGAVLRLPGLDGEAEVFASGLDMPCGLCPAGDALWVCEHGSGCLLALDAGTGRERGRLEIRTHPGVPFAFAPMECAMHAGRLRLLVAQDVNLYNTALLDVDPHTLAVAPEVLSMPGRRIRKLVVHDGRLVGVQLHPGMVVDLKEGLPRVPDLPMQENLYDLVGPDDKRFLLGRYAFIRLGPDGVPVFVRRAEEGTFPANIALARTAEGDRLFAYEAQCNRILSFEV